MKLWHSPFSKAESDTSSVAQVRRSIRTIKEFDEELEDIFVDARDGLKGVVRLF